MQIKVLSLFPEVFEGFCSASIIGRARKAGALDLSYTNIRDYSTNKHRKVDDYPYGGFAGMVMQAEALYDAINAALEDGPAPVIYFSPMGRVLNQQILQDYSSSQRLILLCGHYKDIDQRVRDLAVSDEISIGDYVLSGGEAAAMVFIDGLARLLPDVLGDIESAKSDSFSQSHLGFPCYSRPESFMGLKVPQVLLKGNHAHIQAWAKDEAMRLTRTRRPDLLKK